MQSFDDRPAVPQPLQILRSREDLKRIVFRDGMAAVEVPFHLLRHVRFRNDRRDESPRLAAVRASVRRKGYVPFDPIICAVTKKGKWSVIDGGHRLTAAREVAREFWTNLFGRKVRSLYFILVTTPRSLTGIKGAKKARRDSPAASELPARAEPAAFEDEDEDTRV